ncbi:MAG: carboxypeptidase-like regulatory domain-containing protein, partial [Candidatus Baltobacteraceae bacterium]
LFIAAAFICALFATAGPAAAQQTTGTISGTVTNTSGAPVAGVRVTAVSTGQTASTTTDTRGFYALQSLTPDTYTVSFQGKGYSDVSIAGVTVQQGLVATLNQQLGKTLQT